jgi:hypothetical protein
MFLNNNILIRLGKIMNKIMTAALPVMGLAVLMPASSFAAESGFIPRASLAVSQYSFTQKERPNVLIANVQTNNQTEFPEVNFDVVFNMLGVGGTFYYDKYYADLFYQHSDYQSDEFVFPNAVQNFVEEFKGNRRDYAFTVGMKILDFRGSIYAGYKVGKSRASGTQQTRLEFIEDGFFVGANYSWPIGNGNLTVNLAIADLDGELKEQAAPALNVVGVNVVQNLDLNAESSATGLSYGVAWSAPMMESGWNYSVSVDANQYTFEDVKDNGTLNPPKEFEEEFVTARVTFSYNF